MKSSPIPKWLTCVAVGLLVASSLSGRAEAQGTQAQAVQAQAVQAQAGRAEAEQRPVAVISLASIKKVTKDISFLTKAADIADLGGIANLMIVGFTQGVDTSKPAGVYVNMDGALPQVVAFLPVIDFDTIRRQIEERLGELEDAGNGVLRVSLEDRDVYLKSQNGWLFVSDNSGNLAGAPQDPSTVLGDLHTRYDLAIQLNVRGIPAEVRDMIVTQMKSGFERGFDDEGLEGNQEEKDKARAAARAAIDTYVSLVEDTDQVTLGWAIDTEAKQTYVDVSVTAVADTTLAGQMALMQDSKSAFQGFQLPGAAMTLSLANKMGPRQIEQSKGMVNLVREQVMNQIENEADLPDAQARETVKGIAGSVLDVVLATLEEGNLDGGAAMILRPQNVQFVAGGQVADGAALEVAFRKLVDMAKNEPEFPQVKFNADKYQGVTFHTMTVPIPESEAESRKVLGEELDVALALGAKSFYVAFGPESIALIKQVIDGSKSKGVDDASPLKLSVAVGPLMSFANSMEPNPLIAALANAVQGAAGRDHILLTARPIERGVTYRVNVEDGVLKLIGQAVQLMSGQQRDLGNDF